MNRKTRKSNEIKEKRTNQQGRKKKEKKEKKGYEEKMNLAIRSTYTRRIWIIYESKSIRISLQKPNKMAKRISSWIPIAVESSAIMKNMSS